MVEFINWAGAAANLVACGVLVVMLRDRRQPIRRHGQMLPPRPPTITTSATRPTSLPPRER